MRHTVPILGAVPLRKLAMIGLLVAGITACSLAGFGYDIAPRLAVRYADDYLALSSRQEARALELFRERKALHQEDELPQYAILLVDIERRIDRGVTKDDFNYTFNRVNELWDLAVKRTVPAIATILSDLDEDQLGALEESLADSEERYRERIKEHDPEERREDRFEDIEEWTGELDDEQRAFIDARLDTLHDTRIEWLEWRIERNTRFMALLNTQPGRDAIEDFMINTWAERDSIDPELRRKSNENRVIYRQLLVDLADQLREEQKENVAEKVAEYREIVWDLLDDEERLALEQRIEQGTLLEGSAEVPPETASEVMGTQ